MTSIRKIVASMCLAGNFVLQMGDPAYAHAHLNAEIPAADSTGTAPQSLTLGFTEAVVVKLTGVVVTGPKGNVIETGNVALSDDGKTLTVPLKIELVPGRYSVTWHALAVDGHKTHGVYRFTVTNR